MTENSLINLILQVGIFPAMFLLLFIWTIRDSSAREKKLNETINKVNDQILSKTCETHVTASGLTGHVERLDAKVTGIDDKVDEIDRKTDKILDKMDVIHQKM